MKTCIINFIKSLSTYHKVCKNKKVTFQNILCFSLLLYSSMINIQVITVFFSFFVIICAMLIHFIYRIMKTYKRLKRSHERLKQECLYLSILINRNESQMRVFKQYEANYMQLLSIVKTADESMYVRLRHICNAHNISFPTKLPHQNNGKI